MSFVECLGILRKECISPYGKIAFEHLRKIIENKPDFNHEFKSDSDF